MTFQRKSLQEMNKHFGRFKIRHGKDMCILNLKNKKKIPRKTTKKQKDPKTTQQKKLLSELTKNQ